MEALTYPHESWRLAWRCGIAPLLSDAHLEALRRALREDSPQLLQGATTWPPPLQCVQEWPVEAACVIGYCGWKGDGLETAAEVEEFFAKLCFLVDERLGEPAGCRWAINWFDETPRVEMIASLLPEVEREIARRKTYPPPCVHSPDGLGLCPECQGDYDDDPSAYLEYGNHVVGIVAWKAVQAERAEDAAKASAEAPVDDLPF